MRHVRGELEGFWKAAPLDRRGEDADALPKFGRHLAVPTMMGAATKSVAERAGGDSTYHKRITQWLPGPT